MKAIFFGTILGLFTALTSLATANEFRTFTNTAGKTMEARVTAKANGKVKIQRKDGTEFTVAVTVFTKEDQDFIATWEAPAAQAPSNPGSSAPPASSSITFEELNTQLGAEIFSDHHLWDDADDAAGERLKWRRESKTDFVSSYRSYPRAEFRFLGARPFSTALYAEDGKVTSVSLVFANKGDTISAGGDEAMDQLKSAMESDSETISEALTNLLGEGENQRFGDGAARASATRWDWNDHAFLLVDQPEEYLSLAIQPKAFADAGGKVSRVPETMLRKRVEENVERRANGDVVISNLPMVDQGPKGYCVPATYERCMRYLGVPADMYILAMSGNTAAGGGSSISAMAAGAERDIRRKGRQIETIRGEVEIRKLARYLDKGLPVMWTMYSTKPFNDTASARTKARKEVTDWDDWASQVEEESESRELVKDRNTAHVTLIVGYNKETGEIAFSDSWGERYMERWITAKEAEEISQGAFQIVKF